MRGGPLTIALAMTLAACVEDPDVAAGGWESAVLEEAPPPREVVLDERCGNTPVDPAPVVVRTDLATTAVLFAGFPTAKATLIERHGELTATELRCGRSIARSTGASSDQSVVVARYGPEHTGHVIGSTGAGPCVGVIFTGPPGAGGVRTVAAFHFTAGTADIAGWLRGAGIPAGSQAAVFGGDGSSLSNRTMTDVVAWILASGHTLDGISNTAGLWVGIDHEGSIAYYRYRTDVPSQHSPD